MWSQEVQDCGLQKAIKQKATINANPLIPTNSCNWDIKIWYARQLHLAISNVTQIPKQATYYNDYSF